MRNVSLAFALIVSLFAGLQAADEPVKETPKAPETPKGMVSCRFFVEGAFCAGCAEVLKDTLQGAGVVNMSKIPVNNGKGGVIVAGDVYPAQLGKVAGKVNAAMTPHKKQAPPAFAVELLGKMDDKSAEAAKKALAGVKGVDAEHSVIDAKLGLLGVKLDGKAEVSLASLQTALKTAGVDAAPAVFEKVVAPKEAREPIKNSMKKK